jgi:hypothetical protein
MLRGEERLFPRDQQPRTRLITILNEREKGVGAEQAPRGQQTRGVEVEIKIKRDCASRMAPVRCHSTFDNGL